MSTNEWDALYESDRNAYAEAYKAFMYEEDNEYNCSKCPESQGCTHGCGAQNCWVTCHINSGIE